MKNVLRCRNRILPAGEHLVKLTSVQTVASPWNRSRDATEFTFSNDDGEVLKLTGANLRIGESLHGFAEQLLGAAIGFGDEIDFDAIVGRSYRITVVPSRSGGVAVDRVAPLSE